MFLLLLIYIQMILIIIKDLQQHRPSYSIYITYYYAYTGIYMHGNVSHTSPWYINMINITKTAFTEIKAKYWSFS